MIRLEGDTETRKLQVFTRLYPSQIEALIEIGEEMQAAGNVEVVITRSGEINTSEVIRLLLAKADRRMKPPRRTT